MTPFLDVRNLTKRIGDLVLFEDISFSIGERQKVGLIARNGAGKSTLLNILCGDEDYDEGEIVFRRDLRVAYLEQMPHVDASLTVLDACLSRAGDLAGLISRYERCLQTPGNPELDAIMAEMDVRQAWNLEQQAKEVLSKLKITDFEQLVGNLSGGQLKRLTLANALLAQPDLLILDEPTNHLDIEMIEWLEKYLQRQVKSLFIVTHDRYFLDRVCERIIEIDDKRLYAYEGNYEYYLEKRSERIAALTANIQRSNNTYRRELEWRICTPHARSGKARFRKEAFAEIEALAHRRVEQQQARLVVKGGYIGSKIFEVQYVSKAFAEQGRSPKVILKDFYYNFSRYEKMGIVGNNGTGKTTFIKMLLGLVKPDEGRIVVGETVRFGYYSQDGLQFSPKQKVIDAVREIAETVDIGGGRRLTAMQFLSHFLFPPARQQDYVYKLSGGELRRLYLCTVLMQAPNFLILDEPTNDLDIATLQILEEYLVDFKGCVIVVSHDRYFMDRVVDHILVFQGDGVVDDFPGTYSQYRLYQEMRQQPAKTPKDSKPKATVKPREEKVRRLSYKEKCEMEQLEAEIDALEAEKKQIETMLSAGTASVEEIVSMSKRLPQLSDELDTKSMRWLELSELS